MTHEHIFILKVIKISREVRETTVRPGGRESVPVRAQHPTDGLSHGNIDAFLRLPKINDRIRQMSIAEFLEYLVDFCPTKRVFPRGIKFQQFFILGQNFRPGQLIKNHFSSFMIIEISGDSDCAHCFIGKQEGLGKNELFKLLSANIHFEGPS